MNSQLACARRGKAWECILASSLALALLSGPLYAQAQQPAVQQVVYPSAEHNADRRDDYAVQLLDLALRESGKRYELKPHALFMLQARSLGELEQGRGLDVVWTMTTRERERQLLPIRIPIDRGLLGWRLLMVRKAALPRFAEVNTLEQLQALSAGQGADWPDTVILKAAGLPVDESARYGDLFRKLDAGRIDYFPRSAQEIWDELATPQGARFVAEPHLALHYPAAMYFFVNRNNKTLAEDIQRGLERALKDGSFEALFKHRFDAALRKSDLAGRHVLELKNPELPAETPLADAKLWYRP